MEKILLSEIYRLEKSRTTILGCAFIMATVTAIVGGTLYGPVLSNEDFLTISSFQKKQVVSGVVFEMLLVCANSFTAILMYPYLKQFSQRLGIAYICFRLLEVVVILIGIISILAMLSLSQAYQLQPDVDKNGYKLVGSTLKAIHYWTFILGPNFLLGINTLIYSSVLYQSGMIPKRLSMWGILAALLILITALLEIFEIVRSLTIWAVILAIPIALYEMVLAGWLIANGFDLRKIQNKMSADNFI